LMALLSLLVKRTSNSCGVAGRLNNKTLPFSQHRENYALLLLDFANRSLIHIFALQNPQIVSISPQSHHVGANAFSFLNNCYASLLREGCACAITCCTIRCSQCRRLLRSYGVSDGPADSIHYLAHRFLCKRLQCLRADSYMSWLNSVGTLICETWFSKEQEISTHPHHLGNLDWTLTIDVVHLQLVGDLALFFLSCLTQNIFVSYFRMMETPQSCLQKSTPT
jgi:hypothetical protein